MLPEMCSILLAVVSGPLPDYGSFSLRNAWFTGSIRPDELQPLSAEIYRNSANKTEVPSELAQRNSDVLTQKDCSAAMRDAGLRVQAWPKESTIEGRPVSPDGEPAVYFKPVHISKDRKHALVTWIQTYGDLASSYQFAILTSDGSKWRVIRNGSYGPVA